MLKYFKRKSPESGEGNSQPSKQCRVEINAANMNPSVVINVADIPSSPIHVEINMAGLPSNPTREEINLADLPSDPGLRCCILDYHPNDRDQVRKAYLQKGPCQPRDHQFPQTQFGPKLRRFNKNWFRKFPTWLEYSVEKNAAYCLCYYLFKPEVGDQSGGESFVGEGFSNWKKNDRIQIHVGGPNSAHNQAWGKCQDLVNQRQHIQTVFDNQSNQTRTTYRIRLNASIDCIRFLLKQGLSFRGHDESKDSSNKGNFLELLKFLADHNEEVKGVTLKKAPGNDKLVAPKIQKDIVSANPTRSIVIVHVNNISEK